MPIKLPSGLYSQFTKPLDMAPIQKMMLQRQAKDEALNKYFSDLPFKLNTAGVRQQDISSEHGGIDNDLSNIQDYWVQNSDAIKKGGIAQQEYLSKINNVRRKIDQSKARAKTELEIGRDKIAGKTFRTKDVDVLSQIGKSIYDQSSYKPDGSEYGVNDLTLAAPDFDPKRMKQFREEVTSGFKPSTIPDESKSTLNEQTGNIETPYSKRFTDDQIKLMAQKAQNLTLQNDSAGNYYDSFLRNTNSDQYKTRNEAYKRVFGGDDITTPEQMAAADTIIWASIPIEEGVEKKISKKYLDELTLRRQQIMEAMRSGNVLARQREQRHFKEMDEGKKDAIVTGIIGDYANDPKNIPQDILDGYKKTDDKGHRVNFTDIKFDPKTRKFSMDVTDPETKQPIPYYHAEAGFDDVKQRYRRKIETPQVAETTKPTTPSKIKTVNVKGL